MGKIKLVLLLILSLKTFGVTIVNAQDIIGKWEDSSTYGSAGNGDTYIFKNDGTFTFFYSQYEWAGRRIISFSGQYYLKSDSIFFKIYKSTELTGGHIENDGPPNGAGWIIVDGIEESIMYNSPSTTGVDISFLIDGEKRYAVIDFKKYIFVSEQSIK